MVTKQTLLTALSKFLQNVKRVFISNEEIREINDTEFEEMFNRTGSNNS